MARPKVGKKRAPGGRKKKVMGAAELKKLAARPWRNLSASQQKALRSWRAKKGAVTRKANRYDELIDRLNSTNRQVKAEAREELRREGTRGMARYLKKTRRWDSEEIKDVLAFWFYS